MSEIKLANLSIYEKIENKGIQDAKTIKENGVLKAKEIETAILKAATEQINASAQKNFEKNENLFKTKTTEFEQSARQVSLSRKKALMDEAFQKALVALNNLDAPQWEKLVLKTLSSDELLGNETILASKRDRGLFLSRFATNPEGSLVKLDKLDKALKGKKFALSLSDEFAPINGGFFVIGANFDIDHSFSAMLSSVKDQYESEIASLLFDGRE